MIRSKSRPVSATLQTCYLMALFFPLAAVGQDAREIARRAFPSLVLLEMFDSSGRATVQGSGFFVRSDIIATNYHVIEGQSKGYAKIVGRDGQYQIAGIVGLDPGRDLVLLKLDGAIGPPLMLGDVSRLEVGEEIYALGNPKGLEGTISSGIIGGMGIRHLQGENLIQITAPISPGSSGGPVVNKKGEVIGIAVASLNGGQNLNFAVPAAYLALLIADIRPAVPLSASTQGSKADEGPDEPREGESCGGPGNPEISQLGYPPRGYCYLAESLLKAGRYAEARDASLMSVRLKPSVLAYGLLADAYLKLGCAARALDVYQQSLVLDPKNEYTYYGVGYSYSLMGRYEDAAHGFKESIRIKPKYANAHFGLGSCYYQLYRENEAIEEFRTCISLNARRSESYQMIGACLVQIGASPERTGPAEGYFKQAKASYEEAIRIENKNPRAHFGLGEVYVLLKDKQKAMEQYQVLVVLDRELAQRLLESIRTDIK